MRKILFFILLTYSLLAQEVKKQEIDIDEFVRTILPISGDGDLGEKIENLYGLYQDPIDINTCDEAILQSLFFLNQTQIKAIIKHREEFGSFVSLYELQSIEELDGATIKNLIPFVKVKYNFKDFKVSDLSKNATENYLVLRTEQVLEPSKGFSEDKYEGSRLKLYSRFRMSHARDFSIGFISEKDAGEKSVFDYYNFHLQIQNKGRIKNLIVGDFLGQFGQGLIYSAGYAPGKSSEPVYSTRRSNLGLRPYNSVVESGSMRGIGFTYVFKNVDVTPILSYKRRDASILADDDINSSFSSLSSSGFHRTATELENKNAVLEQNLGLNINYKLKDIQLGFSVLQTSFDKAFEKNSLVYNALDFNGKTNVIAGPNFTINLQNFNFFGEAAKSSSGGSGFITGFVSALSPRLEWALNFRNYQSDFHSFYGSSFSENSRTINEKGVYNGLKFTIKKGLELAAYYDNFRFPWLKYRVDAPSAGDDFQVKLEIKPNKIFRQTFIYHEENKQRNTSNADANTRYLIGVNRKILNSTTEYTCNKWLKTQTKIQFNIFKTDEAKSKQGFAFIQDIEAKFRKISLKTRAAYFNTDGYDNRVYAYENDVLYAVSFPAYFGKGMRYYVVTKLPLRSNIDLWLRWSRTAVSDRSNIGSGNDAVGNVRDDLKLQIKIDF